MSEPFGSLAALCVVSYILAAAYVVQTLLECEHKWEALLTGIAALLILVFGLQNYL